MGMSDQFKDKAQDLQQRAKDAMGGQEKNQEEGQDEQNMSDEDRQNTMDESRNRREQD